MPTPPSILEALDLEALPPEEQESLLLELNELIFKGSLVRLFERMDEATRDDFSKLVESEASDDAFEAFLKERVPDADAAIAETVEELASDILAANSSIQ